MVCGPGKGYVCVCVCARTMVSQGGGGVFQRDSKLTDYAILSWMGEGRRHPRISQVISIRLEDYSL